jgi:hypothetical protein
MSDKDLLTKNRYEAINVMKICLGRQHGRFIPEDAQSPRHGPCWCRRFNGSRGQPESGRKKGLEMTLSRAQAND